MTKEKKSFFRQIPFLKKEKGAVMKYPKLFGRDFLDYKYRSRGGSRTGTQGRRVLKRRTRRVARQILKKDLGSMV